MFNQLFKRFSGSHYRRFYRKAQPIINRINALEAEYQKLSDAELQAHTQQFRDRFKAGETLDDLLPEAFATVKNAARRLCGQTIEYVGTQDVWNMVHFDVQLLGGMALHRNNIAEMATGEGKTLVATLPLYLNALSGRNCQLVTVNEYLAQRDAEWMGHLYKFLGLTVGVIRNMQPPEEKRAAYACDITYGTASEFGFDYLRDNGMAMTKAQLVQRDHFFCIIDEVDSILIDEARTPLIISGPVQDDSTGAYLELKPDITKLARAQTQLCNRLVNTAKTELEKDPEVRATEEKARDEAVRAYEKVEKENAARVKKGEDALPLPDYPESADPYELLFQVKLGAPKNKVLRRLLEEGPIRKEFERVELNMAGDFDPKYNKNRRQELKEGLYYAIDEKQRTADMTEMGRNLLRPGDDQAFILPDLPTQYMEIDARTDLEPQQKAEEKAKAQQVSEKLSEEMHIISQLLRAYSLYERDVEYVVQEGKVMIVDENTGRVMPGRRWSEGLHQAVEAKEGVKIEKESRTYATITLQNYFRLYEKLAGMTGTAETEATEFKDIYKMDVVVIPPNKPNVRNDENDIIYKTRREKYNAVIEQIQEAHERGQPVLVGTVSVDASEVLSRMLKRAKIPHNVLNAKYHAQEAEIVAGAGQRGSVTIATNMAGRGTDIKLGEGVPELGGLFVLGTERHTSRRIDRQLRGRCARQGDPGHTKFYLSLEDELMRLYSQGSAGKLLESSFVEGEPLEHKWLNTMIERAQKTVEQHHYSSRRRLLQYDDVGSKQREIIYNLRHDALQHETPKEIVFELIDEEVEHRLEQFSLAVKEPSADSQEEMRNWVTQTFPVAVEEGEWVGKDAEAIHDSITEKVREAYTIKEAAENPEALQQLERMVVISNIDRQYQQHLTEMEDLRQAVGLRGYGQKDPLVEYKSEAFTYFEQMMERVRQNICTGIFRSVTNMRAFDSMVSHMRRRVQTTGPAPVDGDPNAPAGKRPAGARPLPRRAMAGARAAAPAGGKEIVLPKVTRKPAAPKLPARLPARNDTVTIRKGDQTQTLKWKKAETMVRQDGWQLVEK